MMADDLESTIGRHLEAVRADVRSLRSEVGDLSTVLHGRSSWGLTGLLARVDAVEKRVTHLGEVQEGFVRERTEADRAAEQRAKLHNRVQAAVLTLLTTIVGGVILLLVQLLVMRGGGP